jgi:hypothetical protein
VDKALFTEHEIGGQNRMRVWRESWPDGTFEVLTQEEFKTLKHFCERLRIPLLEHIEEQEENVLG